MEDFKKENGGSYTSEGRKLRPRKKVAAAPQKAYSTSEGRSYGERKSYGEKKSYGTGERRSYGEGKPAYGERKSYGDRKPSFGENKPYGERKSYGTGERRSYGEGKPAYGERKSYGDRKPSFGENKPYGERKSYGTGERRSYGEGKPAYGERKSYGDRKSSFGENKPYGERKSYGTGERRSYGEGKPAYGERKSYGDRKPSFGERKPYARNGFGKKNYSQFNKDSEEGINRMISRAPMAEAAAASDFDAAPSSIKEEIRLNKFIANSGVCSRREADTLIQAGVVTVNGEVITELGTKVNVLTDDIRFNGERLKGEEKVYIVMNKPKGFVTTASDPHAEKTVLDLLKGCETRVYPVGRLDKATTGVLMFTNDGEMAESLTHPSYNKKKIYQVILDGELKQEDYDKILAGVELSDGEVAADSLEYIDENDHRKLGIEIHSGKNRVVRRIFESLGYDVRALDRVYFAGLTKRGLKKGEWRYLTEGEVNILKMGSYV